MQVWQSFLSSVEGAGGSDHAMGIFFLEKSKKNPKVKFCQLQVGPFMTCCTQNHCVAFFPPSKRMKRVSMGLRKSPIQFTYIYCLMPFGVSRTTLG